MYRPAVGYAKERQRRELFDADGKEKPNHDHIGSAFYTQHNLAVLLSELSLAKTVISVTVAVRRLRSSAAGDSGGEYVEKYLIHARQVNFDAVRRAWPDRRVLTSENMASSTS
jgi:hypothetical protein